MIFQILWIVLILILKTPFETAPSYMGSKTGHMSLIYLFIFHLGIFSQISVFVKPDILDMLLLQVWAQGQAITNKLWLSPFFLLAFSLCWNGWACTVELTITNAFLLIYWHISTVKTPSVSSDLTSQQKSLLHFICLLPSLP